MDAAIDWLSKLEWGGVVTSTVGTLAAALIIWLSVRLFRRRGVDCGSCGRHVPKWFAQDCSLPASRGGHAMTDVRCRRCLGEVDEYPSWIRLRRRKWLVAERQRLIEEARTAREKKTEGADED